MSPYKPGLCLYKPGLCLPINQVCVSINQVYVSLQIAAGIPHHVLSSRRYFFDNPRRYDSDDDLAWSIPPQNAAAR